MFKKFLITSMIVAHMSIPVYAGGMSVDAIYQAEFFKSVKNPVISEINECNFENGNLILDLSYENTGEHNLWTAKVLYKPGTFVPEVIEVVMDSGNIHSIGINTGSALGDSNGYEVIIVTFTDQIDVNVTEAGVYYNNAVLPEVPDKVKEDPKASGEPQEEQLVETPQEEEEPEIPEEETQEELEAEEEPIQEEPKQEIVNEEPIQEEPKQEEKRETPKEEIKVPDKKSIEIPQVQLPKEQKITEEPEAEVPELPKEKEPMAEVDTIEEIEINEGQEDVRQVEEQEEDVEIVVSDKEDIRKTLFWIIGIGIIVSLVLLINLLIQYKNL